MLEPLNPCCGVLLLYLKALCEIESSRWIEQKQLPSVSLQNR